MQNNYLCRHKCYDVLNVITEVTARKINCSATEVLTSNPNHWTKSSVVSKASCSPKRKGTLAKSEGERKNVFAGSFRKEF